MSVFSSHKEPKTFATIGDIELALQSVSTNEYNKYLYYGKQGRRLMTLQSKAAFYKGEPLSGSAIEKTAAVEVIVRVCCQFVSESYDL